MQYAHWSVIHEEFYSRDMVCKGHLFQDHFTIKLRLKRCDTSKIQKKEMLNFFSSYAENF